MNKSDHHAHLLAISPLDGRYSNKTSGLSNIFSESALIQQRIWVECAWLKILANNVCSQMPDSKALISAAESLQASDIQAALAVKDIEQSTNHDVKAVEYWLAEELKQQKLDAWVPFIHFGCTSEDINNLAYGRMLLQAKSDVLLPELKSCLKQLADLAADSKAMPMLARTHGQSATPTTMGKELCNFADRISKAIAKLEACTITGKFNGAVGNFNAHSIAFPDVDWKLLSHKMIEQCALEENSYTTQIEPHDDIASLMQQIANTNTILIDLSRDIWTYISYGYFKQAVKQGEVGSSTMPHKVNPIDFENAEGNLGLANALAIHLASKLPISRLQRDLTDSTVMRNLGSVFGYCSIALQSLLKGLKKLTLNSEKMLDDLNSSWEVLAEAIQTCLRAEGDTNAYDTLKQLTRGKKIDQSTIKDIIDNCKLHPDVKTRLQQLTPASYIGYATELTEQWLKNNRE